VCGAVTLGEPRNVVLDGDPQHPTRKWKFDAAFAKLLWPLAVLLVVE